MVEKYDDAPPFFKKKTVKEVMESGITEAEFRKEFLQEPEPIKKKEYVKPEVLSVEEKPKKELTPKEKARQRIQYL